MSETPRGCRPAFNYTGKCFIFLLFKAAEIIHSGCHIVLEQGGDDRILIKCTIICILSPLGDSWGGVLYVNINI